MKDIEIWLIAMGAGMLMAIISQPVLRRFKFSDWWNGYIYGFLITATYFMVLLIGKFGNN